MNSNYSLLMGLMQLPTLLATVAALVFAVLRWSKHPMTSMLVVVGASVHLLTRVSTFFTARLAGMENRWLWALVSAVSSVGTLMLLVAIFTERGAPGSEAPRKR